MTAQQGIRANSHSAAIRLDTYYFGHSAMLEPFSSFSAMVVSKYTANNNLTLGL